MSTKMKYIITVCVLTNICLYAQVGQEMRTMEKSVEKQLLKTSLQESEQKEKSDRDAKIKIADETPEFEDLTVEKKDSSEEEKSFFSRLFGGGEKSDAEKDELAAKKKAEADAKGLEKQKAEEDKQKEEIKKQDELLADANAELEKIRKEKQDAEKLVAQKKAAEEKTKKQLEELQKQGQDYWTKEKKNVESEIQRLVKEKNQAESELKDLTTSKGNKETSLSEMKKEEQKVRQELKQIAKQEKDLTSKMAEINKAVKTDEDKLNELSKSRQKSEALIDTTENAIDSAEKELKSFARSEKKLKSLLSKQKAKEEDIAKKLKEVLEEQKTIASKIKADPELKSSLEKKSKSLSETQKELEVLASSAKTDREDTEKELQEIETSKKDKETFLAQQKTINEKTKQQLADIRKNESEMLSQQKTSKKEVDIVQKELDSLSKSQDKVKSESAKLMVDKVAAEKELSDIANKITETSALVDKKTKEESDADKKLAALTKKVESAGSSSSAAEEKEHLESKKSLENKLAETIKERVAAEKELNSLTKSEKDAEALVARQKKSKMQAESKLASLSSKEQKQVTDENLSEPSKQTEKLKEGYVLTGSNDVTVHFKGDVSLFDSIIIAEGDKYMLKEYIVQELNDGELNDDSVGKVVEDVKKALIKSGFYLAIINTQESSISKKSIVLNIDEGRFGKMIFWEKQKPNVIDRIPYKGKYYSERQLVKRMEAIQEGKLFDYYELYGAMFDVNTSPDLLIDIDLNVKTRTTDSVRRRYADMNVFVDERLPLHAVLEAKNTGTKTTDEMRLGLTVQNLNLTKHDDVLTLTSEFAPDPTKSWSVAGSYYFPFEFWKDHSQAVSVYGGLSSVSADIPVEQETLVAEGDGYFVGAQFSTVLFENDNHLISWYLGAVLRNIESALVFEGERLTLTPTTVIPGNMSFSYASKKADALYGGRTYLTLSGAMNMGGSTEAELQEVRTAAVKDFFVGEVQLARLQPILLPWVRTDKDKKVFSGDWTIFGKFNGQFTADALIPSEQKAIGGMETVRGYEERIFQGDNGVNFNIELRTPLILNVLDGIPGISVSDRLQFLAFFDFGWVDIVEPQIGYEDSVSIYSAGPGIRYSIGKYFSARLDVGFPLKEVKDTAGEIIAGEDAARASFRVQLQF